MAASRFMLVQTSGVAVGMATWKAPVLVPAAPLTVMVPGSRKPVAGGADIKRSA